MKDEAHDRRRLLHYVMLAVFVWGTLLAAGALLFGFDPAAGDVRFAPNIWRGLIVEACVLGFLLLWWGMSRRVR